MVGVYENYVKSQTDLTDVFLGGETVTPEQATQNRETLLTNLGIDPTNVPVDRQLEIVGDHHFNVMGGKNENRTIAQPEAPPSDPLATQASVDSLQQKDLEKFKDFFSTMPEVKKDLDFNCPKCGHNEQITVKGMQNFFV